MLSDLTTTLELQARACVCMAGGMSPILAGHA